MVAVVVVFVVIIVVVTDGWQEQVSSGLVDALSPTLPDKNRCRHTYQQTEIRNNGRIGGTKRLMEGQTRHLIKVLQGGDGKRGRRSGEGKWGEGKWGG